VGLVDDDEVDHFAEVEEIKERHDGVVHEESFGCQKDELGELPIFLILFDEGRGELARADIQQFRLLETVPEQGLQWYEHDNALIFQVGSGVLKE
jgi:hypothetical protein